MWYVLEKYILSAKVELLTQFNVTKYGKTGIGYIEQMTYAVGSLLLKSIVLICIDCFFKVRQIQVSERYTY